MRLSNSEHRPGRHHRRVVRAASALALLLFAVPAPALRGQARPRDEASPPKRVALLVGIDDYAAVRKLKGCVNDVEDMRQVLTTKFGFSPTHVRTLVNGEATRSGILTAFREHLIEGRGHDDVVVFYFSGHGSRSRDMS